MYGVDIEIVAENSKETTVRCSSPPSSGVSPLGKPIMQQICGFTAARSALRACFPVDEVAEDDAGLCLLPCVKACVLEGLLCRLSVHPKTQERAIGTALHTAGVRFDPKAFSHVVSVYCGGDGRLEAAVTPRAASFDVLCFSAPPPHEESSAVCRARYKLDELQIRSQAFARCLSQRDPCVALDIGASPGGWSAFLSEQRGWEVMACDPGKLDASVVSRSNVTHLQCMVQSVDWPSLGLPERPFGLIVSDMNGLDCRDEMRLMLSIIEGQLRAGGGLLVVTLKLPQKCSPSQAEKLSRESIAILEGSGRCKVEDALWLLANRNNERTLVASVC